MYVAVHAIPGLVRFLQISAFAAILIALVNQIGNNAQNFKYTEFQVIRIH